MSSLSPELESWRRRGRHDDVFGRRVFSVQAGPASAEALLILHGYPTSSLDFEPALAELSARYRVVVHDHLGFGLSDKPADYSYSLIEQADAAIGLWRQLGIARGHLIAHDYGTSVATEILARRERDLLPIELDSVTLCNGSVHIELSRLSAVQRLLVHRATGPLLGRMASYRLFRRQLRRIFGEPGSVPERQLELMWEALVQGGGKEVAHQVSRYQLDRTKFWHRWIGALERLDVPAHVLWGRRDPIAVPAIAETLAAEIPGAELTWLDQLGHYPMLEAPRAWAREVLGFLA